jgi:hypothetical protein
MPDCRNYAKIQYALEVFKRRGEEPAAVRERYETTKRQVRDIIFDWRYQWLANTPGSVVIAAAALVMILLVVGRARRRRLRAIDSVVETTRV